MSNYEELCAKLGIDRGAIAKAADVPWQSTAKKEPGHWHVKIGKRVKPPGYKEEDVSHLVKASSRRTARKLRARAAAKKKAKR